MGFRFPWFGCVCVLVASGCALDLKGYKYSCPDGTVIDLDKEPGRSCRTGTGGSGSSSAGPGPSGTGTASSTTASGVSCPNPWEQDCGGTCVDPLTDPTNCNGCGKSCNLAAGEICQAGGAMVASCANVDWAQFKMPNTQLDVAQGAPNPMSYLDNGDGTVTDVVTHLVWQQAVDPGKKYTVAEGKAYCSVTLSKMGLGGHHDWRLPSFVELLSLVDYAQASPNALINSTFFPNTPAGAGDVFVTATGGPTAISFKNGQNGSGNSGFVRCVR
jgi:hypothetical protein